MAKKKKEQEQEQEQEQDINDSKIFEIKSEPVKIMLKPQEWALAEKLNPILFEGWKDMDAIDKEQFNKLKEQVM